VRKVLILGCKGTLGQALMANFNLSEYEVVGWDREEADITSLDIKGKIIDLAPQLIINATGYNAVDKCEVDPLEKEVAYKINTEAPKFLAEVSKEIDAVFINYSSDYVFQGDKINGYAENDTPDPISVYGRTKYDGEKNVQSVGGKYYIIRPSRIFGKPGISNQSKKSFVDVMVGKIKESEIKVVDEERGSPTYAPDLADFTRQLVEQNLPYGIYHGANSGSCTWFEWAKEIFNILESGPKIMAVSGSEFPRPAKRPMYSELINTKTKLQRSWQEALKEYLTVV